jgi:hypothetical protein
MEKTHTQLKLIINFNFTFNIDFLLDKTVGFNKIFKVTILWLNRQQTQLTGDTTYINSFFLKNNAIDDEQICTCFMYGKDMIQRINMMLYDICCIDGESMREYYCIDHNFKIMERLSESIYVQTSGI